MKNKQKNRINSAIEVLYEFTQRAPPKHFIWTPNPLTGAEVAASLLHGKVSPLLIEYAPELCEAEESNLLQKMKSKNNLEKKNLIMNFGHGL